MTYSVPVTPLNEMREYITVQRKSTADDGYGGQVETWVDLYENVHAKVVSVRGREVEQHGRKTTIETYLVITRHGYATTTEDRIIWGGKTMNVTAIADREGVRRRLTHECEVGSRE